MNGYKYYLNELTQLYPYMFKVGFWNQLPEGWIKLFALVCGLIDEKLTAEERYLFEWHQCKEKFGAMRLYFAFAEKTGKEVIRMKSYDALSDLCQNAENISSFVCQKCGDKAKRYVKSGYSYTACQKHM